MTIVLSQPPSVSSYLVNSLLHTELSIETVNKDKNNKTARKGRFYHLLGALSSNSLLQRVAVQRR
jgi:hypothetical protein